MADVWWAPLRNNIDDHLNAVMDKLGNLESVKKCSKSIYFQN